MVRAGQGIYNRPKRETPEGGQHERPPRISSRGNPQKDQPPDHRCDGHWIEYTPVFAERMRKVVGDKGADGFIASQRRIPDALSQTIEQRKARGAAMEGYWGTAINQYARPRPPR